ncbi:MAG: C25 family cysteine peptidase [Thermoplasmatota archaeon]
MMKGPIQQDRSLASALTAVILLSLIISMISFDPKDGSVSGSPYIHDHMYQYADVEYAIVVHPDTAFGFDDLFEWRSQTGTKAKFFGTNSILDERTGYLGRDDSEKLFNFIKDLYEGTDGNLKFVLLGGDADLIPTRYLHAGASAWGMDDQYLSDVYYSAPTVNWDMDGDGIYGEREDIEAFGYENLSFPIKVGRLPVSNSTEAQRYCQRIVEYEKDPPKGNWTRRGIISSSLMDRPNVADDPGTPEDEGYNAYKDNGYKAIENYTLSYIPRSLDLVQAHDYEIYEGGEYAEANDTLANDTLAALLSEGASFFTFAGQSFYDVEYPVSPLIAYSLAQWFAPGDAPMELGFDTALTSRETWNITNGNKLPVVYISSCDSANFSDPQGLDLSNILYAPNGGALCFIGSTGISWRGEGEDYSLGNWFLMPRYWERFMKSGMPGEALYELKEYYLSSKWGEIATKETILVGLYAYNYLGDPAARAWVGEPKEMKITSYPEQLYAGGDTAAVEVKDKLGTPVLEAKVAIRDNYGNQVFSGLTGPDGRIDLETDFFFSYPGVTGPGIRNLTLTATARNKLPVTDIEITLLEQAPNIRAVPGSIVVSPEFPTEGSVITITGQFENIGVSNIQHAVVELHSYIWEGPEGGAGMEPEDTLTVSIPAGSIANITFEIEPLRSWTGITIAARRVGAELDISDNYATLPLHINSRPRFLPFDLIEMEEDSQSPRELNLTSYVFDPDPDDLVFTLDPGSPDWITITGGDLLRITPPPNWSGLISVNLHVTDGSAEDAAGFDLYVTPVNDPPVLMGLMEAYTAYVDSPFSLRLETLDVEGDEVNISFTSDIQSLYLSGNTLKFVPYDSDVGLHELAITIADTNGANSTYQTQIDVKEAQSRLYFTEPSLHLPDALIGESYSYRLKVGGDLAARAVFTDNTTLFDIDPASGLIEFNPRAEDKGEHWVKITVTSGNTTITRSFLLNVREQSSTSTLWYWVLGGGIVILLAVIIGLYLWSGRELEQYGLEE